ncbi:MAG: hypothetical protein ABSC37_00020 [Xanthobacteraceae bacterium]
MQFDQAIAHIFDSSIQAILSHRIVQKSQVGDLHVYVFCAIFKQARKE